MAKNSTVKAGGPARVRLVVFDAEVPDGDFNSLAQVLQNALKTPTVVARVANGASATKIITHQPAADPPSEDQVVDDVDAQEIEDVTPAAPRAKTTRKAPKAPDIVPIEMNAPLSFADFVAGKKIDSAHKKYLAAAAWLHEHRNTPVVTEGHIYTCFRSIGWSTAIADFSQPLRELKFRKFFTTPSRGQYEINHIGLDHVKKLAHGPE